MKLNLSGNQLDELRDLIKYSLSEISSEIRHAHSHEIKNELKMKKEELLKILSQIESEDISKAA